MNLPHHHPLQKKFKHRLKWALIHIALVIFFADTVAVFWPAFEKVWNNYAHLGVALAALLATLSEYISEEIEEESKK